MGEDMTNLRIILRSAIAMTCKTISCGLQVTITTVTQLTKPLLSIGLHGGIGKLNRASLILKAAGLTGITDPQCPN